MTDIYTWLHCDIPDGIYPVQDVLRSDNGLSITIIMGKILYVWGPLRHIDRDSVARLFAQLNLDIPLPHNIMRAYLEINIPHRNEANMDPYETEGRLSVNYKRFSDSNGLSITINRNGIPFYIDNLNNMVAKAINHMFHGAGPNVRLDVWNYIDHAVPPLMGRQMLTLILIAERSWEKGKRTGKLPPELWNMIFKEFV